jgi:hypothetical protein
MPGAAPRLIRSACAWRLGPKPRDSRKTDESEPPISRPTDALYWPRSRHSIESGECTKHETTFLPPTRDAMPSLRPSDVCGVGRAGSSIRAASSCLE